MSINELEMIAYGLFFCLRSLYTVLRARLVTVVDALSIERTANDVVTHAGEVLYSAASDENHRVLLQVMTDARNVSGDFDAVGKSDSGDLTLCRVRLFRCLDGHLGADASLLRGRKVGSDILYGVGTLLESGRF